MLAQALEGVLGGRALWQWMRRAAREHVRGRYTRDHMTAGMFTLYGS